MYRRIALSLSLFFLAFPAYAQSVQQSGSVTPNTAAIWNSTGVIKGGVTATDSPLTTFGVTRNAADAFCVSSDRQTAAGRNQLCFQAATNGPGKISLQNYGTATPQDLQLVINGTAVVIPTGGGSFLLNTGGQTTGHMPCFTAATNVLQDCGVGVGAGIQYGLPYYSSTGNLTSTAAAGPSQFLIGQSGARPEWLALTGDVQNITTAGAVTLGKVNGIPFSTSYTAGGVLIGNGSSAFQTATTSSIGQCLLSQGAGVAPIFSSCASGSGSAGGSDTQVQFNNSTALGGSVNFTWVNPTLTIGVAGTTTGQLALASSTATGTVTLQAPGVSGAYNFNFPTGAGTSGQPLISGGGGSSPNTFGTLGVFGGGTNCTAASGTCLDNITGFASTGFVFRSGAGTYTFANPIPVGNGGTGLANGTSGGIIGFTGTTTIASSGLLAQNGLMIGGGAGATPSTITACTNGQLVVGATSVAPACQTISGDISTITSGGAVTIANSAISNAKLANANAYTLKGNTTGSAAAPTDFTIGSLTQKASPAASDFLVIQDQAASGALKYATVSSIASAGSVASFNGQTGAITFVMLPQGRLTLQTGTPVMTTSQSAKSTLYYDCLNGGSLVPYYTGAADATDTIGSCEVSDAMVSAASAGQVVSGQVYDVWWVHGGANRICLAMSSAVGGGGGWASDTFGSATARGTGYTQLDTTSRPYITNKNGITNCFNGSTDYGPVSANQGTYLGTIYATANGQSAYIFGGNAAGGTASVFGVWNAYNRVSVAGATGDTTDTWNVTSVPFQNLNAGGTGSGANNRSTFVRGLDQDSVKATLSYLATSSSTGGYTLALSLDGSFTGQSGRIASGTITQQDSASYAGLPGLGLHYLQASESCNAGTCVGRGDNGETNLQGQLQIELRM